MEITSKTLKAMSLAASTSRNWAELNAVNVEKIKIGFRLVAMCEGMVLTISYHKDQWPELVKIVNVEYGFEIPEEITEGLFFIEKKDRKDFEVPFFVSYTSSEVIETIEEYYTRASEFQSYKDRIKNAKDNFNEDQLELILKEADEKGFDLDGYRMKYPDYRAVLPKEYLSPEQVKPEFFLWELSRLNEIASKLGLWISHLVLEGWNCEGELAKVQTKYGSNIEIYMVIHPAPLQQEMEEC